MDVIIGFDRRPLRFSSPRRILSCFSPSRLADSFDEMESLLDRGYYLAGFLSYEAGYAFEGRLAARDAYEFPLLYLGCYDAPAKTGIPRRPESPYRVSNIGPSLSFEEYRRDIERIRAFIARGETYQITYCLKMKFDFAGDARSLFADLLREQPVPYPAFIDTGVFTILSLSPELFVRKQGSRILTKPMKGTWPRGGNVFSDAAARFRFSRDEKNRAENLMITDLLRNDLGRAGGRVRVPRLFEVTGYRTLFQMTSTVTAAVDGKIHLRDLFAALFPSGSVTGAPKMRSMEIIRELEKEERRIYTGAIGYIAPDRSLFFNVPIRTLLIKGGKGEMGVGGGIIWDSTPEGEWAEGMLKARFLRDISS